MTDHAATVRDALNPNDGGQAAQNRLPLAALDSLEADFADSKKIIVNLEADLAAPRKALDQIESSPEHPVEVKRIARAVPCCTLASRSRKGSPSPRHGLRGGASPTGGSSERTLAQA